MSNFKICNPKLTQCVITKNKQKGTSFSCCLKAHIKTLT